MTERVKLICLDTSNYIEPDNPAAEIYDQMLALRYPERPNGEPTTMQQLKLYWHFLRRQSDKLLVMIIYDTSASPTFSPLFLNALSKFDGAIAIITNNQNNQPSLQQFSQQDPQLVENIIKWIE